MCIEHIYFSYFNFRKNRNKNQALRENEEKTRRVFLQNTKLNLQYNVKEAYRGYRFCQRKTL